MSNLPALSVASDAVVKAVLAKTIEIQSSGNLSLIADGYRVCSALAIRSALQLAGLGAAVTTGDIVDNLVAIADNLDPQLTENQRTRIEAEKAIESLLEYTEDSDDGNDAIEDLRAIIKRLTQD
jgi:hypothetical protein